MIGPGQKTPCRQQRCAIGGKWQQAGSPGHGNQPATAPLRGVPRKDTGIARIQGLPGKSPPLGARGRMASSVPAPSVSLPPLGARERMSPRHRQAGNKIQETGQSRKPGNKKARRCRQHTSKVRPLGGGELGVWRAASAGARRKRWRREGDSNPRRAINPYTLSRRAT